LDLTGTKTHDNLKAEFAGKADVEGQSDVAALFRSTAEGETGRFQKALDVLTD